MPEVGHVSVMDGRLSLDRVPMPEGRAWPNVIICAMKHRS